MAKLLAPTTKNSIQKTLASQLLSSAGNGDPISFDDVDGVANLPGVLVINRIDSNGTVTPAKREYIEYSGTSGNTVLIETRNVDSSSSALTHAVGSVVEFIPDVTWADRIYDALSNVVSVADLSVDTTKIVTPTGTQTLTNKTLTTPTINGVFATGGTLTGVTLINAQGISSPITDGGSFVYPTGFETIRALSSTASASSVSYTQMEANASVSLITSGHGHIILTPATSKLVKFSVLRQNITTDAYTNNQIILTGWNYLLQAGGGSTVVAKTITYGLTFTAVPIVVAQNIGIKYTTAPTAIEDLTTSVTGDGLYKSFALNTLTTTTFKADSGQTGNAGADTYRGFAWIAIGTL